MRQTFDEFYEAIDDLEQHLRRRFIGPSAADEVLYDEPAGEYDTGILWAETTRQNIETVPNDDKISEAADMFENELEETSDTISHANQRLPSAMGLTICTKVGAELVISFRCGRYALSHTENGKPYYSRYQEDTQRTIVVPDEVSRTVLISDEDHEISLFVRNTSAQGNVMLTVSVVNHHKCHNSSIELSANSMFQCELSLYCANGFLPLFGQLDSSNDVEDRINDMLYRNVRNYAFGHGCSVRYEDTPEIHHISSEFIPSVRLAQMIPAKVGNSEIMRMSFWKDENRNTAEKYLNKLADEYEQWAADSVSEPLTDVKFREVARITKERLDVCVSRVRNGITTLMSDDTAWRAFLLMNEAMLLQRIHSKPNTDPVTAAWFPFQLAYIIMIVPDILEEASKYRDTVDLLWFPTGGGKTEAYLGVSAFSIFYRRLNKKPKLDGVTVLMRYTLRLLTIQQFERAVVLICACEHLRRKYNIPGGEISIGMWIGGGITPNHNEQAAEALEKLRVDQGAPLYEGNPRQLTKCPWCGAEIDLGGYYADAAGLKIRCNNNSSCEFNAGFPVYLTDDDVYTHRPTLVISTVDKFARLTWEERSGAILGSGTEFPPELIIQDELHLISGPLGTITGVYEAAIDEICRSKGRAPKIIASTATARHSAAQIKTLYNRKVFQFPPNGADHSDSFFAHEAGIYARPARTYIGLCSSGGTSTDLLIKIYGLLMYLKHLYKKQGRSPAVIDNFFTDVGYFNSLRDLGTSATILTDRIMAEVNHLITNVFSDEANQCSLTIKDIGRYQNYSELTSRKSSVEIKKILGQLDERYTSDKCLSYVLASNMLSVGIDISRLGIMTVYGQPKSNSEYIQATSRVGRSVPGAVLTLYNQSRSRDKSHYEQFPYYHRTYYRCVEASSVTTFSTRAIEKALHCAFTAMLRHISEKYNPNSAAKLFRADDPIVVEIRGKLIDRVRSISPGTADYAAEWLDYFCGCWEERIMQSGGTLEYNTPGNENNSLLISAENINAVPDTPRMLNAVRNVQPSSDVYVIRR